MTRALLAHAMNLRCVATLLSLLACAVGVEGCGKHPSNEMCGWDVFFLLLAVAVVLALMRVMAPRDPFSGGPRDPDSFPGD